LLVVVTLGPSACVQRPGSTRGTVNINVLPGESADGSLVSGQWLRATSPVEAGHIYQVSAGLTPATAGSTILDGITGEVSGAPLVESVEFAVGSSADVGSDASGLPVNFATETDGEVVIEFRYLSEAASSADEQLESVRALIRGPMRANYSLLITDLGADQGGGSPEDAIPLAVGVEGEEVGTLILGDEADHFVLQVVADTTYRLSLEATASVSVTSGSADRFGQVNFGVATAGGLIIDCSASAGDPCSVEVLAPATEEVLLRLTGAIPDTSSTTAIQYAISVVAVSE
jgi:hypothetical protein